MCFKQKSPAESGFRKLMFNKFRTPLRIFAAFAIGLGLKTASAMDIPKVPLRIPFSFDVEVTSVDTLFEVSDEGFYAVNITFQYDESAPERSDRKRVWSLVGGREDDVLTGQSRELGAPVELEVSIKQQRNGTDTEVLNQKIPRPRLSIWGDGTLTSRLAVSRLVPGRYHLVVINHQASPSLHDVRAHIGVVRAYLGK